MGRFGIVIKPEPKVKFVRHNGKVYMVMPDGKLRKVARYRQERGIFNVQEERKWQELYPGEDVWQGFLFAE